MEKLAKLDSLPLVEARAMALDMVNEQKIKTAKAAQKKKLLVLDLERAPSSAEISRIMWMRQLAKDGLASTESTWAKGV